MTFAHAQYTVEGNPHKRSRRQHAATIGHTIFRPGRSRLSHTTSR